MKKKRIARTKLDLLNELEEQVAILVHACRSYDSGLKPIGKHIALSLRTLLHHHGNSRALLEQLSLRNKRFLDTAGKLDPDNLATEWKLCTLRLSNDDGEFMPSCAVGGPPTGQKWVPFADWWNGNVVKDNKGRHFNRRQLVLNVADTDGGAHVDPELDEAYMDLSRNNSLGWEFVKGDVTEPFPSPTMPCIRQIAHEVLETLRKLLGDRICGDYHPVRDDLKNKA